MHAGGVGHAACDAMRCDAFEADARNAHRESSRDELRARDESAHSAKNDSIRSTSNLSCGGNCHKIGPRLSARQSTPDARKLASAVSQFQQLQHVRDVTTALHRKHESRWGERSPVAVVLRTLKRIERAKRIGRAVELDGLEEPPWVGQLVRVPQPIRIEHAAPRRIMPSGDADVGATGRAGHGSAV